MNSNENVTAKLPKKEEKEVNTINRLSLSVIHRFKWYIGGILVAFYGFITSTTISQDLMEETERKILEYVKTPYKAEFVNIGQLEEFNNSSCSWFKSEDPSLKIWTLTFNENSENIPLVIIHGFCAAAGLWALNVDALAKSRTVYAIDLIGFGSSSRPDFSNDAAEVEAQHVQAIEAWRKEMKIERFVLLGHSMGAFLSTAYSLKYTERVAHVILADPWGFPEKPENIEEKFPVLATTKGKIIFAIMSRLNPLGIVRTLGFFGPRLINRFRPDLVNKFTPLNQNGKASVAEYIYLSNSKKPSGEVAMRTMTDVFAWAKNPMVKRFENLKAEVPVTIIYGSTSWVPRVPEDYLKQLRPSGSFLKIYTLEGAGHHVYADDQFAFNSIVNEAGSLSDIILTSTS